MIDLFKEVLKYLPLYLKEFIGLLRGPKRFLKARIASEGDEPYTNSLIFVAVSFCLIFLIKWSGADDAGFKTIFIKEFLLEAIGYAVTAVLLALAWRLLKCREQTRGMTMIYSYLMGVLILVQGLFFQFAMGSVRMIDADQFDMMQKLMEVQDSGDMRALMEEAQKMDLESPMAQAAQQASVAVASIGDVIALAWFILVWGAFRELYGVSRGKSVIAFLLFLLLETLNPYELVKVFVLKAVT